METVTVKSGVDPTEIFALLGDLKEPRIFKAAICCTEMYFLDVYFALMHDFSNGDAD